MKPEYIPQRYWDGVHDAADDERAVGYPNLARSINRARYDVERRNVARALETAGVARPDRVLDVGAGTGIWIDFWKQRGARTIVGVDLSEAAVQRLRKRYPEHEFLQRDLGDPDVSLPGSMDVVSAMSVLLHITDEARFERALEHLLACVADGGSLVLVEPLVVHRWWGAAFGAESNSKARPLAAYTRVLDRAGFQIVELRPMSCVLANVIDTRRKLSFRLMERYWDLLSRIVGRRERLGAVVAALLRPIDLVATRLVAPGPSSKVVVARRTTHSLPGSRRSDRLRVLMLPEWYPSASNPYAGVFVRDQAQAAARVHDVTVLIHDKRARAGRAASVSDGIEDGLRTIRVHTSAGPDTTAGRIAFLLAAARVLRNLSARGEGPEVIHAHVFSAGLIALLLSRRQWPVVVSEHHTDFIEGKVRGRDAVVARLVFKHADLVCPVSTSLKAHLQAFEPSGRYEVVPNVIDAESFTRPEHRGQIRTGPMRLLTAASLVPQKGIEYLLDALVEVRRTRSDFTLDVLGDGSSRSRLERIARERLPGVVTFHGARRRTEVAAFMARSDVFVLPSVVETFGVALIEALAAGLPIIATRAVPDHERLAGRFGIIVAPHDTEALRDAVLRCSTVGGPCPPTLLPSSCARSPRRS